MAYTPNVWVDDDATKPLSAARLSTMEAGIEDADNRLNVTEARVYATQAISYAASITPDALTGSVFYCIATGNLTLNSPSNGVDGKHVTVAVKASGTSLTLTLPDATTVWLTTGQWWAGRMVYLSGPNEWLMTEGV